MKHKNLPTCIELAHKTYSILRSLEELVQERVSFKSFDPDEKPSVALCPDGDFLAEWQGKEMPEHRIFELMGNKGCIEPGDFI